MWVKLQVDSSSLIHYSHVLTCVTVICPAFDSGPNKGNYLQIDCSLKFSQCTTWGSLRDIFCERSLCVGDACSMNYLLLLCFMTHFPWNEFLSCSIVDGSFWLGYILLSRHGMNTRGKSLWFFFFSSDLVHIRVKQFWT